MRPAGIFAKEMGAFESDVYIRYKKNRINAKSLLNIIAACIKCGAEIDLEIDGPDEKEAMARAIEIIETGLSE